MKKYLTYSFIIIFSLSFSAYAEDEEGDVLVKDGAGGTYIRGLCKDPKGTMSRFDRFWEAMPGIGGKFEDAQTSCCLKTIEDACVEKFEDMSPPTEKFANCGHSLMGQCGFRACAAWADDCLKGVSDTFKFRKLVKQYLENKDK